MARIVAEIIAPGARPNLQEVFKAYAFGPFRLDPSLRVLALQGEPLPLGPRTVATLAALVERPGQIVTKGEILDQVWPHEDVGESSVAQAVYELRKVLRAHALGDAIATVPRRGYRFTAPVELVETICPTITAQMPAVPAAAGRAAPHRWLRIAFAVVLAAALAAGLPTAHALPRPAPLSARGAELYRVARYHWNLRTWGDLAKSESLFRAVVRSDPRSAL
ncbi:MAG: transcriptional regulator, partial [Candidatus Elarobacter sp.]